MDVFIGNRYGNDFTLIHEKIIKNTINQTILSESINAKVEVSVSIVNIEEIRVINNKYRNLDKPTDVLSFPLLDFNNNVNDVDYKMVICLGDIVICWDKVISQSDEYGHSIERELAFLTVHGMLHLLGYDHMSEEEANLMFAKQRSILFSLNLIS